MKKADEEYLEFLAEFDGQGNVVRESKFDSSGELEERNEYRYSPGGKLIEHVLLFAIEDVTERRVLRRDEQDRLLEELKMYGDDTGERMVYSYDDADHVLSVVRYDEEGELDFREEFTYDEKGDLATRNKFDRDSRVVEQLEVRRGDQLEMVQVEYNESGKPVSTTVSKFDAAGNEVSNLQTSPDGKLISAVYSSYDDRGNAVERVYKDFYSKTIRSEYDDQYRLLSQELFDSTGLLLRKNVYEYDENGNVITEQVFEIDASGGGRDKHYGARYEYELNG